MKTNRKQILLQAADQCNDCGSCIETCPHLQARPDTYPGDIAEAVLDGEPGDCIKDFILKCSLCGLCRENCPEEIDIPGMVREVRSEFIGTGISDPEQYRFLWVDHDWNTFTLYRHAYQIDEEYGELLKDTCDVVFFPGCMLSCESPELVRAVAAWLGQTGESVAASLLCCGAPLDQMGLRQRAAAFTERLWARMASHGARRLVTACPTCHQRLVETNRTDMEIVSIYDVMAASGMVAPVSCGKKVVVHDSCSDRHGDMGRHVRGFLEQHELREMAHSRSNTICCGSGGIVSAVDPEICQARAGRRMKEVAGSGADLCVTYCMACAHRLAAQSEAYEVRHILELLLDQPVDHEQFNERAHDMWSGEAGEKHFGLLARSRTATL